MKCTAHRQDGNPCTAYAIKGGSVCRVHGGSAPQVRAAALRRLLEAVDPAAGELIRIGLHAKQEAVRADLQVRGYPHQYSHKQVLQINRELHPMEAYQWGY